MIAILLAALVPMITGFLWYSKALFGKKWMQLNGFTEESLRAGGPSMAVIFGVTYLFSLLLCYALLQLTIHQTGMANLLAMNEDFGVEGTEVQMYYEDFLKRFGGYHRSFGHGMIHGGLSAISLALPILGINALFERRGWAYIGIHFGYWFITLILMGGIICQFVEL